MSDRDIKPAEPPADQPGGTAAQAATSKPIATDASLEDAEPPDDQPGG